MRPLIVTTISLLAALFVIITFSPPQTFEQSWIWVWIVAGSAAMLANALFSLFINHSLNEFRSYKRNLTDLVVRLECIAGETDKRIELERKLFLKELEILQQKIQLKDSEINWEIEKRRRIENMHWEDYYYAINEAQRREIQGNQDPAFMDFF